MMTNIVPQRMTAWLTVPFVVAPVLRRESPAGSQPPLWWPQSLRGSPQLAHSSPLWCTPSPQEGVPNRGSGGLQILHLRFQSCSCLYPFYSWLLIFLGFCNIYKHFSIILPYPPHPPPFLTPYFKMSELEQSI